MKKKKNTIYYFVIICILVVFVIISYISPRSTEKVAANQLYEKIMAYDLEDSYPGTPFELMNIDNEIMHYLYCGNIPEENIESVIVKQRELYDKEFLNINPVDVHIKTVKDEIEKYKQGNFKIISILSEPPVYNDDNPLICSVRTLQYSNANTKVVVQYYLQKNDDLKWRIIGYKQEEPDEQSEG